MRLQWLLGGLAVACGVGLQLQFGEPLPSATPSPAAVQPAPVPPKAEFALAPAQLPAPAPVAIAVPVAASPAPAVEPATLSVEQAQLMMREYAAGGDERQPAAGGLRPRVAASPAQLAAPELYDAFESAARRREVQAWTMGLQQIPHIREQIDQAAQRGERSAAELAEANQALEQLELLQQHLQQSDAQLLQPPAQ